MESVPRLPMLKVAWKASPVSPDISPIKKKVRARYEEQVHIDEDLFRRFLLLRTKSFKCPVDSSSISDIKRYFAQLLLLKNRIDFTSPKLVEWPWQNALTDASFVRDEVEFEEAAALYDLGSAHSILGQEITRHDDDTLKAACTHFQCASWVFQALRERYPQFSDANDMHHELFRFYYILLLNQAQECITEKAIMDQRKPSAVASLSKHLAEAYQQCSNQLNSRTLTELVPPRALKEWKTLISVKVRFFSALSNFFAGIAANTEMKFGTGVAWLRLAEADSTNAMKLVKDAVKSTTVGALLFPSVDYAHDIIIAKCKSSINDNDTVFHDRVPSASNLEAVKGICLAKPVPFDHSNPDVIGDDIFKELLPIETLEASSMYSEIKANFWRSILAEVEEKNNHLDSFISSLNLDPSELCKGDCSLPQALLDVCAQLKAMEPSLEGELSSRMAALVNVSVDVETDTSYMDGQIQDLNDRIVKIKVKLADYAKKVQFLECFYSPGHQELHQCYARNCFEITGQPKADRVLANKMDSSVPERLIRLSDRHSKLAVAVIKAKESNTQLNQALSEHLAAVTRLLQSSEDIEKDLPSVKELVVDASLLSGLNEAARVLAKVDEMRKQREKLVSDLRIAVLEDDLTQELLSVNPANYDDFFKESLKRHDGAVAFIQQNMAAQDNILKALVEINASVAVQKHAILEQRERRKEEIDFLIHSGETFGELLSKCDEGQNFYKQMSEKLQKLQSELAEVTEAVMLVESEPVEAVMVPKCQDELSSPTTVTPVVPTPPETTTSSKNYTSLGDYMRARKAAGIVEGQVVPSPGSFAVPVSVPATHLPMTPYWTNSPEARTQIPFAQLLPLAQQNVSTPVGQLPNMPPKSSTPMMQSCPAGGVHPQSPSAGFQPSLLSHPTPMYPQYSAPSEANTMGYFNAYQYPTSQNFLPNRMVTRSQNQQPTSSAGTQPDVKFVNSQPSQLALVNQPKNPPYNHPLSANLPGTFQVAHPASVNQLETHQPTISTSNERANLALVASQQMPISQFSATSHHQYAPAKQQQANPQLQQYAYTSAGNQPVMSYSQMGVMQHQLQQQFAYPFQRHLVVNPTPEESQQLTHQRSPVFSQSTYSSQEHSIAATTSVSQQPSSAPQYMYPPQGQQTTTAKSIPQQDHMQQQHLPPSQFPYSPQQQQPYQPGPNVPPQYAYPPRFQQTQQQQFYPPPQNKQPLQQQWQHFTQQQHVIQQHSEHAAGQILYPAASGSAPQLQPQGYQQRQQGPSQTQQGCTYPQQQTMLGVRPSAFHTPVGENGASEATFRSQEAGSMDPMSLTQASCNNLPSSPLNNILAPETLTNPPIQPQVLTQADLEVQRREKQLRATYSSSATTPLTPMNSDPCMTPENVGFVPSLVSPVRSGVSTLSEGHISYKPENIPSLRVRACEHQSLSDPLVLNRFVNATERLLSWLETMNDPADMEASQPDLNRTTQISKLDQAWARVNQIANSNGKRPTQATARCSASRNRNQDCVPFDMNRVVLTSTKEDYINASHMDFLSSLGDWCPRYILTQAPLPSTIGDYWNMIFEQGCEVVVFLPPAAALRTASCEDLSSDHLQGAFGDPGDKRRIPAHLPMAKPGSRLLIPGSQLEVRLQAVKHNKPDECNLSTYAERMLTLQNRETQQTRSLVHLTYTADPPTITSPSTTQAFEAFVQAVHAVYKQQRNLMHPVAVVCETGCGFGGLFITASVSVLHAEVLGQVADICDVAGRISQQRHSALGVQPSGLAVVAGVAALSATHTLACRNIVVGPRQRKASEAKPIVEATLMSKKVQPGDFATSLFSEKPLGVTDILNAMGTWKPNTTFNVSSSSSVDKLVGSASRLQDTMTEFTSRDNGTMPGITNGTANVGSKVFSDLPEHLVNISLTDQADAGKRRYNARDFVDKEWRETRDACHAAGVNESNSLQVLDPFDPIT